MMKDTAQTDRPVDTSHWISASEFDVTGAK